ncbi:MAG: hypothetical protein IT287_10020 [Bdellovibrionaceae bacterium]|nr:hypothetical protein [Pseudobdellovibrionaceae bacterium]
MSLLIFAFTFFSASATETPICENLFVTVEALIQAQPLDVAAAKKELFKIGNDKRTEMVRFVRTEKEKFRKVKDAEMTAFDVDSKNNKTDTNEERNNRRQERATLSARVQVEKKVFNSNLDTQDKVCQKYLKEKREEYLSKIRELQNTDTATKSAAKKAESALPPELDEFKDIPKGPGTVLKPQ